MKKLRNLTITLFLAAGVIGSASAATGAAHAEHDAELRAELSENFSGGLIAVLVANGFVIASGMRVARRRSRLERDAAAPAPVVDAHEHVLDAV